MPKATHRPRPANRTITKPGIRPPGAEWVKVTLLTRIYPVESHFLLDSGPSKLSRVRFSVRLLKVLPWGCSLGSHLKPSAGNRSPDQIRRAANASTVSGAMAPGSAGDISLCLSGPAGG